MTSTGGAQAAQWAHSFDVAPDAKRILAAPTAESAQAKGNLHLTFVFHFFDELKRRLP